MPHFVTRFRNGTIWLLAAMVSDGYGYVPLWSPRRRKAIEFDSAEAALAAIKRMGIEGVPDVMVDAKRRKR